MEDIEVILQQNENIKHIIKKYGIELDDPLLAFIEMEHSLLQNISANNDDILSHKNDIEKILKDFKFKFFIKTEEFNKTYQDFYIAEKNKLEKSFNDKIDNIDVNQISESINNKIKFEYNVFNKKNLFTYFIFFFIGNIVGSLIVLNFFN